MLLFAISSDLGYPVFTNSKRKFISIISQSFHKNQMPRDPAFTDPATD